MPGVEVTSYLVRHAKAGSRERWTAPDRDRPLTAAGRIQAAALARLLGPTTRLVRSSPYLRCVETVAPLAEALGLLVENEDRLAEGADPGWALRQLASTPGSVLCTHGDVMASIVTTLADDHVPMVGGLEWAKAGTWAFDIAAGRIAGARYLPPPG
ncbi:MAG TPA: phosphoglycerate mutase family protein [Candidatus Saccharimonadales bacterium]|nr:phosphoglycerate mutase family protein [Candidatus Saccharimonadales bacterium]